MSEPILDPTYWEQRLRTAAELHHSIFRCPLDRWQRIEAKHREILVRHIRRNDSILDAGCGYGRLLTLMPGYWEGAYLGVDIAPAFIEQARLAWPKRRFATHDLRQPIDPKWAFTGKIEGAVPPFYPGRWQFGFDWAVLISVRPMVRRNCGDDVWTAMEREIRKVSRNLLYLEYDELDEGSIE